MLIIAHPSLTIYFVIVWSSHCLISFSMSSVISFGSTVGVYLRYGCPLWSIRIFSKFHVISSFLTGDQLILSASSIKLSGAGHRLCKTKNLDRTINLVLKLRNLYSHLIIFLFFFFLFLWGTIWLKNTVNVSRSLLYLLGYGFLL